MKNFDEISRTVDTKGGVLTVSMGVLRDAQGAGKLGKYVRKEISEQLKARGLDHLPSELPEYQDHIVRLYRQGSAAGRLIRAVMEPGSAGDKTIREATEAKPSEVLAKIRAIVCE